MSNDNTAPSSAKVVAVGCKLPHGLHLDLKRNDGSSERVTLKGANDARIVGGYGITENVSAEFMTKWLEKNKKQQAVANGSIFIHADVKSAESKAKERRGVVTGIEPIDPIASGMLRNESGENDPKAVKEY